MPIELVLDGIQEEPGPFVEVTVQGITMQVIPTAPGMGKIVRLIAAPLDVYLLSEYAPGQTVCYYPPTEPSPVQELTDFGM
nr:YlzJ-like family protein [Cohnella mopanensis]